MEWGDRYDADGTGHKLGMTPNDAPSAGLFKGMTVYDGVDSGQGVSRQFDTLTL